MYCDQVIEVLVIYCKKYGIVIPTIKVGILKANGFKH